MINVINNSLNPYFNLALEEYLFKNRELGDDVLIVWQNEPTIVVGKNQNTCAEVNMEYTDANNIKVVRRMSGGGAVYHDLGNINFTIIVDKASLRNDFSFFTSSVISCLNKLGVEAEFSGRNDILIDGKKFSGNAQYFFKNKVLHHGTILFSTDLTVLSKALNVREEKYTSKGIKSVQSRVANICSFLKPGITVGDFKALLVKSIFEDLNEKIKNYSLSSEDKKNISELVERKYGTWEWNFGSSPEFMYNKSIRFLGGTITVKLNIEQGMIKDIELEGDFFENRPVEELEHLFVNQRYESTNLSSLLNRLNVSEFICNLTNEDFLKLFK